MLVCGVGSCEGILFPLPHHVHDFVLGIKLQDFVEGKRFDPVLSFSGIWSLKKLNWDVGSCLGWYSYEFWTVVVGGVPPYQRYGRKFPKSIRDCLKV